MKFLLAPVALAASIMAAPAHAWQPMDLYGQQIWAAPWIPGQSLVVNETPIGGWYKIWFKAYSDASVPGQSPGINGDAVPNVAAALTFTLTGVRDGGKKWDFDYYLENLTSQGSTSRVSLIGFDVDPGSPTASISGVFNKVAYGGNVPMITDTPDICFGYKRNGSINCAGGGGGGLSQGLEGGGAFTLTFGSPTTYAEFSNPFVRFQELGYHDGARLINLNSGVGQPFAWVPEPGTWALMIIGFGGAGAMLRRQRSNSLPV